VSIHSHANGHVTAQLSLKPQLPDCCLPAQAAETKALALGAVNSNLLELKRRINSTLTDMLTVTASLETARQRLDRKRAEAVCGRSATPDAVLGNRCLFGGVRYKTTWDWWHMLQEPNTHALSGNTHSCVLHAEFPPRSCPLQSPTVLLTIIVPFISLNLYLLTPTVPNCTMLSRNFYPNFTPDCSPDTTLPAASGRLGAPSADGSFRRAAAQHDQRPHGADSRAAPQCHGHRRGAARRRAVGRRCRQQHHREGAAGASRALMSSSHGVRRCWQSPVSASGGCK